LNFKIWDFIPIVIQFGNLDISREKDKIYLESNMFRAVVKKSWNGKNKKFLLTAFDLRKNKKPIK